GRQQADPLLRVRYPYFLASAAPVGIQPKQGAVLERKAILMEAHLWLQRITEIGETFAFKHSQRAIRLVRGLEDSQNYRVPVGHAAATGLNGGDPERIATGALGCSH